MNRFLALFNLTTVTEALAKYADGINHERNRQQDTRDTIELHGLQHLIGKPVIGISNEWENPLVGTVVDIDFITKAMRPIPVVHSALTGETHIALCKIMPFTMQRFEAVMKLTPYERWCLIDDQLETEYRALGPRQSNKLLTYEEMMVKLVEAEYIGIPAGEYFGRFNSRTSKV